MITNRLKKLLIILFLSLVGLGYTISYSAISNPIAYKLDPKVIKSLDHIMDIIKTKKENMTMEQYKNMLTSLEEKIGYLYYEIKIENESPLEDDDILFDNIDWIIDLGVSNSGSTSSSGGGYTPGISCKNSNSIQCMGHLDTIMHNTSMNIPITANKTQVYTLNPNNRMYPGTRSISFRYTSSPITVSLSEDPNVDSNIESCTKTIGSAQLYYTDTETSTTSDCELDPTKTYFLRVTMEENGKYMLGSGGGYKVRTKAVPDGGKSCTTQGGTIFDSGTFITQYFKNPVYTDVALSLRIFCNNGVIEKPFISFPVHLNPAYSPYAYGKWFPAKLYNTKDAVFGGGSSSSSSSSGGGASCTTKGGRKLNHNEEITMYFSYNGKCNSGPYMCLNGKIIYSSTVSPQPPTWATGNYYENPSCN